MMFFRSPKFLSATTTSCLETLQNRTVKEQVSVLVLRQGVSITSADTVG